MNDDTDFSEDFIEDWGFIFDSEQECDEAMGVVESRYQCEAPLDNFVRVGTDNKTIFTADKGVTIDIARILVSANIRYRTIQDITGPVPKSKSFPTSDQGVVTTNRVLKHSPRAKPQATGTSLKQAIAAKDEGAIIAALQGNYRTKPDTILDIYKVAKELRSNRLMALVRKLDMESKQLIRVQARMLIERILARLK